MYHVYDILNINICTNIAHKTEILLVIDLLQTGD